MALQPIAQNAQHQSVTTALKNICREYSAGGAVLRELLQNADDAGATEVRFVLDQKTYPVDTLINPLLAKYQGAALLAYNNAIFTDRDFTSLSRIGDSLKIDDGSTTGKFGRGFNSVFNWTDSPSIVSRERLNILDPHAEWSRGGPIYDFVAGSQDADMKNQMAAFQTVIQNLDRPLEGTVIRIPLRTEEQAKKSEISNSSTTVPEMLEVLRKFGSEFGGNGLLFMKNIEKLEIGSAGTLITIEMTNKQELRSHRAKVNNAVKMALANPQHLPFEHSFQMEIQYQSAEESKKNAFVVHHSIPKGPMDRKLQEWAKEQKLVSWVAVAAKLSLNSTEVASGSLFTVLPLSIGTAQPVLVHGLFSLSPDRSRLHQIDGISTQDTHPAEWNNWLLRDAIPMAWTKLLVHLAAMYPKQSVFDKWPRDLDLSRDHLGSAINKVLEVIQRDGMALWPTNGGFRTSQASLLASGTEPKCLIDALQRANLPIVYVPQELQKKAAGHFGDRLLSPQSLCFFMKSRNVKTAPWSDQTKHEILEYLISDKLFTGYDGIEIFPFKDGTYRSIGKSISFVLRDDIECSLFALHNSHTLDLGKLAIAAQNRLKDGCGSSTIHPSICFHSARSLKNYCMATIFKTAVVDQDMVLLDDQSRALVSKVWAWIAARSIDILDEDISCLWIIPLSNGHHRKVVPRNISLKVYFAPGGEIGDMMRKLNTKISKPVLPLLHRGSETGLDPSSVAILLRNPDSLLKMAIVDASHVNQFLRWLCLKLLDFGDLADEDRFQITRLVASHIPKSPTKLERDHIMKALGPLKIFQRVSWESNPTGAMEPIRKWTNLQYCEKAVGLLDGISPIPDIDGIQFLSACYESSSKRLLDALLVADCLGSVQIINDYIVPAWESGQADKWSFSCKEKVSAFILGQFSSLSLELQAKLRGLPIVPATDLNGKQISKFALAADLIDPSVPELKELAFPDEQIFPRKEFLQNFNFALKGCDLKSAIDEAVVGNRIRCYASSKYPLEAVKERAEKLLTSTFRWTSPLGRLDNSCELRRLRWLPAMSLENDSVLKSATECRGFGDQLLVGSQLPVLGISISPEWKARLGWGDIETTTLLLQLGFGIEKKDRKIVDAVLTYIGKLKLTESLIDDLKNIPCVLGSKGIFISPSQAFRPPLASWNFLPSRGGLGGCERLEPYLATVDPGFWNDHEELLIRLGVKDQPDFAHLLKVQSILDAKSVLEEADQAVAIEMLHVASRMTGASFQDLKVLDDSGKLCAIHDISYNDLGSLRPKNAFRVTHPDIPPSTAKRLGIASFRDRLLDGMEIEDIDDEDEFDQRESITTRIRDTLDRYPVETTFREYLANADDAEGASKISWLLDGRKHPCKTLLTPEMERFQGPGFLVHNDGVFTEKDLAGFKNVGEGSKSQDRGAIGQFGRGSQTMYHWTDVPLIVSGKFLIVLDPQKAVLRRNRISGKRMAGTKLLLSDFREVCPDQLAPFDGLWGYTKDHDYYPGTIFRFPIRDPSAKTTLMTNKKHLDSDEICRLMDAYFNEARISLLFLRRIKSIDFSVHGKPNSGWSITRRPPVDEDAKTFSELVICSFSKAVESGARLTGKDKWWVAIEDLILEVDRLPDSLRRVAKNVECGMAALISSQSDSGSNTRQPKAFQSRMFSTLPLPISTELPVHIHATFSLSGDRQSISIDQQGPESHRSEWNIYLFKEALPKLYLQFLDNVGPQVQQGLFNFWPQAKPQKGTFTELLCDSFWRRLPHDLSRIFPKAQLATGPSGRRAAAMFDINQAVFDFLPKDQSDPLAPLLLSLEVNLVHHIPMEVAKQLKALPKVKSVDISLLRELFKSAKGKICLQKEMAKNPRVLDVLLTRIVPTGSAGLDDLTGCHILSTADGSLGTLELCDTSDSPSYYVVSEEELKLFAFGSRFLVAANAVIKLQGIISSGKFNIRNLHLSHVNKLLKMKMFPSAPDLTSNSWLTKFWKFWNGHAESSQSLWNVDDLELAIFLASCNGVDTYSAPVKFKQLAAVVAPSDPAHQKLCLKIPGLHLFNASFMPKLLSNNHRSLFEHASFYKFIQSIRKLSGGSNVADFLRRHLDLADMKVLRELVLLHVSTVVPSRGSTDFVTSRADMESISLWPSFDNASNPMGIAARGAFIGSKICPLVPWMKSSGQFVDPKFADIPSNKSCLLNLGAEEVSGEVLLMGYVLPLPSTITDSYWPHFQRLIEAISLESFGISHNSWSVLKQINIAPNGTSKLLMASELYDHSDKIFAAAFRCQEESRFVHDSVRQHRSFWRKAGLRSGNYLVKPGTYLQCLQAIRSRLVSGGAVADNNLQVDIEKVLSVLTSPTLGLVGPGVLTAISEEKVFQPITDFSKHPEYRRSTMAMLANRNRLLCLSEVISSAYADVCWSQTSFALHQPSTEAFRMVQGRGQPKCYMVWRHLHHLKATSQSLEQSQLGRFLTDVNRTYLYLQDHLDWSMTTLTSNRGTIWLNINTWDPKSISVDDVKSSWHSIEDLVLSSSCDAGPIKAVKPALAIFEALLRALNCATIAYPIITRPALHVGRSVSKSLQQLRKEGKLLDITYSTEGRQIQAHRVVLAAISEKCVRQFSGIWKVEDVIEYDEGRDPDEFLSYHTLSTMIDYAYDDNIDWKEMEVSDKDNEDTKAAKLDLLLDLAKGADYWVIPSLKSQVEDKILMAGKQFINLGNVNEVLERAQLAGAKAVEQLCTQFIEKNKVVVAKASQERK